MVTSLYTFSTPYLSHINIYSTMYITLKNLPNMFVGLILDVHMVFFFRIFLPCLAAVMKSICGLKKKI